MIVDGKKIADEIIAGLSQERTTLPPVLKLGVLMAGGNAATESFVRIKEKVADKLSVAVIKDILQDGATTKDAHMALERLSRNCQGIIVQLPLSHSLDTEAILSKIPKEKDVDGINPTVLDPDRVVMSPVAEAIQELLRRYNVSVQNARAVVVGAGRLVGKPVSYFLENAGAYVQVLTSSDSLDVLQTADIIVSGVGKPHFIKEHMLKRGVVLIDAGTSEAEGKVAGDADPQCAQKCSIFTPVPGGIGPIAVAMIFKNLFALTKKNSE